MMGMNKLITICFLFFVSVAASPDTELDLLEVFIEGIIETWQIKSPTIIAEDNLPKICMTHQWVLCFINDKVDHEELASYLISIHQQHKQDGLIFVGGQANNEILKQISKSASTLLTSNYPIFMPTSYKNNIQLRLDSNIFFFSDRENGTYELHDIFAVKGGANIITDVGKWNIDDGMMLIKSMNRWDRRTDLRGATFINSLVINDYWAIITKDMHGNINGSKGWFQDKLYYITDNLNLTIEIKLSDKRDFKLLKNGSGTGLFGLLQQKEVDVISSGLGINLPRSNFFDFPIPTYRTSVTLIAALPRGVSLNMWVYVKVFGIYQWMIFSVLLVIIAICLSFMSALNEDQSGREFGTKRGFYKTYQLNSVISALSMVYLYTLQMGSHTNSKKISIRLMTITMSILTLLFFAFFTTDITAKMTSGPSDLPINTFEDVIEHNYKVVTTSPYFTAVSREAWATLPESSSRPLPATLAHSRNLAHASLETAVFKKCYPL